jgi:hypothetical protein
VIWSLDELKLMLTEGVPVSSKFILFLTEYHKVEVLKVTSARLIHFNRAFTVLQIMIA